MADPFGLRREEDADDDPAAQSLSAAHVATAGAVVAVAVAVALAGAAGLLISGSGLAVLATVALVLRMPDAPARRRRPRPAPAVDNAPYRAFRQVGEQLSWAAVSPRHYDLVTRPMLTSLAASRLADRHRVDLHQDPAAARALLGDDVWQWVDPQRPVSRNSQPPGVGRDTLSRIVRRLEQL